MADVNSAIPIPISLQQETIDYATIERSGHSAGALSLINNSPDKLTGLYFGLLADFDLGSFDSVAYEQGLNMICSQRRAGRWSGWSAEKCVVVQALDNPGVKQGWAKTQEFDLISRSGIDLSSSGVSGDPMLSSRPPRSISFRWIPRKLPSRSWRRTMYRNCSRRRPKREYLCRADRCR